MKNTLKFNREKNGLSKFDLSVISRVSIREISYLESGGRVGRVATWQRLAKALGVDLSVLIGEGHDG